MLSLWNLDVKDDRDCFYANLTTKAENGPYIFGEFFHCILNAEMVVYSLLYTFVYLAKTGVLFA